MRRSSPALSLRSFSPAILLKRKDEDGCLSESPSKRSSKDNTPGLRNLSPRFRTTSPGLSILRRFREGGDRDDDSIVGTEKSGLMVLQV